MWPVFIKAQDICEDTFVFENPFPNVQDDIMGRVDAWKSAARQCYIKGAVLDMDDKVERYVSNILYPLQDIHSYNAAQKSPKQPEIPPCPPVEGGYHGTI